MFLYSIILFYDFQMDTIRLDGRKVGADDLAAILDAMSDEDEDKDVNQATSEVEDCLETDIHNLTDEDDEWDDLGEELVLH